MLGTKRDTMCGEAITGFYYLKSQIKLHTLWGEQLSWASGTKGFLRMQHESMKTGPKWLPYALTWHARPSGIWPQEAFPTQLASLPHRHPTSHKTCPWSPLKVDHCWTCDDNAGPQVEDPKEMGCYFGSMLFQFAAGDYVSGADPNHKKRVYLHGLGCGMVQKQERSLV